MSSKGRADGSKPFRVSFQASISICENGWSERGGKKRSPTGQSYRPGLPTRATDATSSHTSLMGDISKRQGDLREEMGAWSRHGF